MDEAGAALLPLNALSAEEKTSHAADIRAANTKASTAKAAHERAKADLDCARASQG